MIETITQVYRENLEILKAKNADYAGETATDPLHNFKVGSQLTGVPVPDGILVRIMDKMGRISSLLKQDANVKDEAITDTIKDAINYLGILYYAINEPKK